MKILITIPHVFAPKEGSLYSSNTESKRTIKEKGLYASTIENIIRHNRRHWVHASLGKSAPIVTRELCCEIGVDLTIQLYTPADATLSETLPLHTNLKIITLEDINYTEVAMIASRKAIEQADLYDMVGYMEDDILIEDTDFFGKIVYLENQTDGSYALIPHRCEQIPELGDVILSGDPDGGRKDLFWDTGEELGLSWPTGKKTFYRATNPHSGCYFLTQRQAQSVNQYWQDRNWKSDFVLAGPLEQAASGMLLPILKVMKPVQEQYRFLMVKHQDELWKRHKFETDQANVDMASSKAVIF